MSTALQVFLVSLFTCLLTGFFASLFALWASDAFGSAVGQRLWYLPMALWVGFVLYFCWTMTKPGRR